MKGGYVELSNAQLVELLQLPPEVTVRGIQMDPVGGMVTLWLSGHPDMPLVPEGEPSPRLVPTMSWIGTVATQTGEHHLYDWNFK